MVLSLIPSDLNKLLYTTVKNGLAFRKFSEKLPPPPTQTLCRLCLWKIILTVSSCTCWQTCSFLVA